GLAGAALAAIIFGIAWLFETSSASKAPLSKESYDVIVIGGEPEGVAAAVSAARNGAEVLLVEERSGLGGLMTFGKLNFIDMVQGIGGHNAIGGIFKEWHEMVGADSAFEIERAKSAFLELAEKEPTLTLSFNTELKNAVKDGNSTVIGAVLTTQGKEFTVYGSRFIDATQDATFATDAGAPYYLGGEDINLKDRLMAVTPVIHLTGVDWEGVKRAAKEETFGPAEVTPSVGWGFSELHYDYKPKEGNTRLRGLNIVRTIPEGGEEQFYINALQIFGVDGLDKKSKTEALEKGNREAEHILSYLRANFPGFENAVIAEPPSELYVRETRHIKSEYMLPMSDIWKNADHWDSIGFGGYPVDVQATSLGDYGYVLSSPVQYAIPFRSLVPLEIENLLVVSRSAGYSSLAAGSARIIPTGMAAGEAGGAAAALSLEKNITFRQLANNEKAIQELRTGLKNQGAMLDHFDLPYPYEGEWFDGAVQFHLDYGLAAGGYTNDLGVEEPLNTINFSNMLSMGLLRIDQKLHNLYKPRFDAIYALEGVEQQILTRNGAASFMISVFTDEQLESDPWNQVLELGLIDSFIHEKIPEERELIRAEGFYLNYWLLAELKKKAEAGDS
ncbi:FAD-dependent oxidoreductase, partial [Planococcus sp. APC 3906]|uniref:FAD-dependent oxidoreductase n=1 Tax=Planococcus sp. APC 3906 TaxID=3035194 RepID=UPI0025B3FF9F